MLNSVLEQFPIAGQQTVQDVHAADKVKKSNQETGLGRVEIPYFYQGWSHPPVV